MRLTGLDDAQIAASLGITVEALLAALQDEGYNDGPSKLNVYNAFTYT